jgi:hypothetical protein
MEDVQTRLSRFERGRATTNRFTAVISLHQATIRDMCSGSVLSSGHKGITRSSNQAVISRSMATGRATAICDVSSKVAPRR